MRSLINSIRLTGILAALLLTAACSSTRHVPAGRLLLDKVTLEIDGDNSVKKSDIANYIKQQPNHKVLGLWKLQLGTYNLSGTDTTKWYNRWVRRMGQPPVIYSSPLTEASAAHLRQAMLNRGYLDADVTVATDLNPRSRKARVSYRVVTGEPHRIASIAYDIPDSALANEIMTDAQLFTLRQGDRFDRAELDSERSAIVSRLREKGYYAFSKEFITFFADTVAGSKDVALTMTVANPRPVITEQQKAGKTGLEQPDSLMLHSRYVINRVYFVTDAYGRSIISDLGRSRIDTVRYKNVSILYGSERYLAPKALEEKCFLTPGSLYRASDVERTYESLARLGILKSINIELVNAGAKGDERLLDVYILLSRNRNQTATFDIEGTNSEGDLGFGLGMTYQHRNLARGSQLFTGRLRMNYESLSGNLQGLINQRYTEFAAETGITYPRFEFPFGTQKFRQRLNVSTEFALNFNYQERPEFTRIIAGGAWKYKWLNRANTRRHEFDLLDINYVYLPERLLDYIDKVAPDNPLLRYSYEDHFIMSMGYRYYRTNKRIPGALAQRYAHQPNVYTLRASVETAGNLLYLGSKLLDGARHDGVYELFGIQYSQYVKGDIDYSLCRNLNSRHALAFHLGFGIGYPYGNSSVLPFEKRFYAGGANGVRGWGVRTLGPGSYNSRNSVINFIDQCGDIRLDMSMEYRAKLFWVLEGAGFIDAGNIWTVRDYPNQPGGLFRLDSFWKEIALAYGLGLRLDFNFFLLRFDLGVKAYNPARDQERWPLFHPSWRRDTCLHFAVGYPF